MKVIPRNHTRKIAEIKAKNLTCRMYDINRDYPVDVDPEAAWADLSEYHFARLWENDRGDWTVRVHVNLWYVLREAPND